MTEADLILKVNTVISSAATQSFNRVRYGIKSCQELLDLEKLLELKTIYYRSIEISNCTVEQVLDDCCGCDLATIEETIKTL